MRDHTCYGSIIILKMLAALQFVITATVAPIPKTCFPDIE